MTDQQNDDKEYASDFNCPKCWQDTLACADCGDWCDACECADIDIVYCTRCSFSCTIEELFNDEFGDIEIPSVVIDDDGKDIDDTSGWTKDDDNWYDAYLDKWSTLDPKVEDKRDPADLKCICDPPKKWTCFECEVEILEKDGPWVPLDKEYWSKQLKAQPKAQEKKCRHYGQEVTFPDGVKVMASSLHEHSKEYDKRPQWGLYCDYWWSPLCRAEFINFPDYDVPKSWYEAADAIIDTYERAKLGWRVEVGCQGGHGRTGTVLACMAVISGVPVEDAIDYIWSNYCMQAVETKRQEWWIGWFAAYHGGKPLPTDIPQKPKATTSTKSTSTTSSTEIKTAGGTTTNTGKQHKKKCKCDQCKGTNVIQLPPMTDQENEDANRILDTYNQALAETKNAKLAERITKQQATGHYPQYDDAWGITNCPACHTRWPCSKATDKALLPGTPSGSFVWSKDQRWTWKDMPLDTKDPLDSFS